MLNAVWATFLVLGGLALGVAGFAVLWAGGNLYAVIPAGVGLLMVAASHKAWSRVGKTSCPHCMEPVTAGATKCPHCTGDIRRRV